MEEFKDVKVIFVIGGPGCGKGTQCERIVKKYGYTHLSSGDLLREEVQSKSEKGKKLASIMEQGKLVPLDDVLDLLKNAMKKGLKTNKGFLIDGYPRDLEQGIRFEKEIVPCQFVLVFDVSEDIMKQRLMKRGETSGRSDDNADTIIKRLHTFKEATQPVIDHYAKEGKVCKIDASGSIESIFENVCKKIDTSSSK
jgi:adenylate kinase